MTKICYFCGREITNIEFRCNFCNLIVCEEHRLPEQHNCTGLSERSWDRYRSLRSPDQSRSSDKSHLKETSERWEKKEGEKFDYDTPKSFKRSSEDKGESLKNERMKVASKVPYHTIPKSRSSYIRNKKRINKKFVVVLMFLIFLTGVYGIYSVDLTIRKYIDPYIEEMRNVIFGIKDFLLFLFKRWTGEIKT